MRGMLRSLSGRAHEVLTGVALVTPARRRTSAVETHRGLDGGPDRRRNRVVRRERGARDKAGAYAIQGLASRFIPRIEGSYTNVVGLPVEAVVQLVAGTGRLGVF